MRFSPCITIMIKMEVSMKFGENEILEREQKLFSTEHRFLNRLRLDALCFQLFLLLAILAVISVCLIGAFRGIVSSAPTVNEKQILTSSKTTILYDKDGNEQHTGSR